MTLATLGEGINFRLEIDDDLDAQYTGGAVAHSNEQDVSLPENANVTNNTLAPATTNSKNESSNFVSLGHASDLWPYHDRPIPVKNSIAAAYLSPTAEEASAATSFEPIDAINNAANKKQASTFLQIYNGFLNIFSKLTNYFSATKKAPLPTPAPTALPAPSKLSSFWQRWNCFASSRTAQRPSPR